MSDTLLEQLSQLLKHKKSKSFYAERLGITEQEVDELLKELRGEKQENTTYLNVEGTTIPEYTVTTSSSVNVDKGTLKSEIVLDYEPKTIEELISLHKVDASIYRVSNYWTKQRGDKFYSSLFCTLIKPTDISPEDIAKVLENYKPPAIEYIEKSAPKSAEKVDTIISIADFHLDRLTIKKDNLEQKSREFINIVTKLGQNVSSCFDVQRLIFVIGNDFFNSDNYQGSTTNLTPQDNCASFSESYEKGFSTLVESILRLKKLAKTVHIVLVQGNHDRTKSYYLAHALEAFFKEDLQVTFDRDHSTTKYLVSGETFIGFHHGNTKIDELPLLFATSPDSAADFGYRKYREILTADKHHYMAKEIKGVRIQQMPSLSNPSRWESDNNFLNNIRAGLAIVYHPQKGRVAEFEERI